MQFEISTILFPSIIFALLISGISSFFIKRSDNSLFIVSVFLLTVWGMGFLFMYFIMIIGI